MRYKFIDDVSVLEVIDLVEVGISSYNVKHHVPSDIPTHNQWIPPENIDSQIHLDKIQAWTENKLMKVNGTKTKSMIFNFTKKYQFATRLSLNNIPLETVSEAKILGVIISDNLKWDANTDFLTKKAYKRMRMLHKLIEFGVPTADLILIYILYIRCICEQSAVLWHSNLTLENETDLEPVQKLH